MLALEAEIWKPVPGYEGLYEASDQGRVRSLDVRVPMRWGATRIRRGRILRHNITQTGYPSVMLSKSSQQLRVTVHRIVAVAFGLVDGGDDAEIDHINRDRADPRLVNLRRATSSQNKRVAPTAGRRKRADALRGAYLKPSGRWQALVSEEGRQTYLGSFQTELEAHRRYVEYCTEKFGEFFSVD